MPISRYFITLIGCLFFAGMSVAHAETVNVAVAANFATPMKIIAHSFMKATGHEVVISSSSTGKIYAQIKNGAPYDIFLAADEKTPVKLEKENETVPNSRFTYAIGRLVLWSAKEGFVDENGHILKKSTFSHLAIASPKLAPYGQAAKETLEKLQLWESLQPKLVQGENIAQTLQFTESGNAELGFVALSQVYRDNQLKGGSAWIVPEKLYHPIRQDAVLLLKGKDNPAATALMDYLKEKMALKVIHSFGYTTE